MNVGNMNSNTSFLDGENFGEKRIAIGSDRICSRSNLDCHCSCCG